MPLPVNEADKCTLDQISDGVTEVETDDLFKRKRMKGWWPVYEVDKEGTRLLNVRTVGYFVQFVKSILVCSHGSRTYLQLLNVAHCRHWCTSNMGINFRLYSVIIYYCP